MTFDEVLDKYRRLERDNGQPEDAGHRGEFARRGVLRIQSREIFRRTPAEPATCKPLKNCSA